MNFSNATTRIEKFSSVIPQAAISRDAGRVHVGASHQADDVKVECLTENGVIQSIQITCPCGREILLACQY